MELASYEKCTGCLACVNSCPKNCISENEDFLGNKYPVIDKIRCVECGKCIESCPVITELSVQHPYKAYAVWSLENDDRKSSTSGGAASVFYKTAIENGSYIVGAGFKDDFNVAHFISENADAIKEFKQSKYVCSDTGNIYSQIKEILKKNDKVLFISLPCKVSGLLSYLGKKYDNLLTVDIVCHGTPSHKNLLEHIKYVSNESKPEKMEFRQDNLYVFNLYDKEKKSIYEKIGRMDTYLAAFLEGLNYRMSCYHCVNAKPERVSDITICDFWGLGTKIPFNHPYTGSISAVLINTEKGEDFFEKSKKYLFFEERPVEEAIEGNAQLNYPTGLHRKREMFESLYKEKGFEFAVNECLGDIMQEEKRKQQKQKIRSTMRKTAGLFIKRYRG